MANSGLSAEEIGSRIENPMPSMPIGTQFEYAIAKSIIARVGTLSALTVSGRLTGVEEVDLVSTNRNLLLVLNPNFISHGNVYAAGPILLQRGALVFGMVVSTDTVFMVERPTVMTGAIGFPVFFGWHRNQTILQTGDLQEVASTSNRMEQSRAIVVGSMRSKRVGFPCGSS